MRWWCSAQSVAWDWTWRPYVGVWLLILLLAGLYGVLLRRLRAHEATDPTPRPRRAALFAAGLLSLWAALDWPLGPLGASYLVSIHVVQFLLVAVVAPPLILLGLPREAFHLLRERPPALGIVQSVTHPLAAFFIFNVVMSMSHWPSIVDTLMTTQLGSFAIDITWLLSGIVFWWPLVCPVPERPKFHPLLKMGYLGINAVLVRPPTVIMLYSKFPAYATYELAPPIPGTSALDDQQLAGVFMKVGSAWIFLVAATIVFFLWQRAARRENMRHET